jgi:cob(I)alamin adenosyltransferase
MTAGDDPVGGVSADDGREPPAALRRGLLQVYTGDGKGKTTAAAGLTLRALGAGLSVTLVQFVKGGRESSELAPLRAAGARVVRPAAAPTGLLRGAATEEDRAATAAAWAAARAALADPAVDLVVLDELHAALRSELVPLPEVLDALAVRPSTQEVVTTGRGAPEALLAAADLITEMGAVRHPYPTVTARRGIDL